MPSTVHFISGLPRSGSTLLSALLRQNPRFHAGVTSPLLMLCSAVQEKMTPNKEFSSFFDDDRRRDILKGLFHTYYSRVRPDQVVFDTNRAWTGRAALLNELYPDARIICCVREVGWIIDSLERILRSNPLHYSRTLSFKPGTSIYGRVETLMNSDTGLVGLAWSTLREAWFGPYADRLVVVQYDTLVREPAGTMARLYQALGERPFSHDFGNVAYEESEYDVDLGMPGLHTVSRVVEAPGRPLSIPPDLFAKYKDAAFWSKPEFNTRGVTII